MTITNSWTKWRVSHVTISQYGTRHNAFRRRCFLLSHYLHLLLTGVMTVIQCYHLHHYSSTSSPDCGILLEMCTAPNMAVVARKRVRKTIAVQTADSSLAGHTHVRWFHFTLRELKGTYNCVKLHKLFCNFWKWRVLFICPGPPVWINWHQMNFGGFSCLGDIHA